MRRVAAFDTGVEALEVDHRANTASLDHEARDYSVGFDETWFLGRDTINLRYRYDYGEEVDPGTEDRPHSELPDARGFWGRKRKRSFKV